MSRAHIAQGDPRAARRQLPIAAGLVALAALSGCGHAPTSAPTGPTLETDAAAACAALAGTTVPAARIVLPGLVSGDARLESAALVAATPLAVAPAGPTPAARVQPALPAHCRVLGQIAAVDPRAEPIRFQVNLPVAWNGRLLQFGGGGFNGTLITALGHVPGMPYHLPGPLAQGFATVGTDSGHQSKPGEPPQAFALNDEMLVNFAHAAYPKVRNVAVEIARRAYGRAPQRHYFVGSSEGGREGLLLAQRYPQAFDGIFSRVPVIHWTGLQFAGARNGLALMDGGWLSPAQVRRVHEATLAACDTLDGLADRVIAHTQACLQRFDPATLACPAGASGDDCLTPAQVRAVRTLRSPFEFPYALANGLQRYPGWGIGGEDTPAQGPTGGWRAWWTGQAGPAVPPAPPPASGIAWYYGAGALQYFYARDPQADPRRITPDSVAARVREVSALMDATQPDLSAFHARGGKLIVLEHLSDYAQSPFAGIDYVQSVQQRLGEATTRSFLRLFTAPGVDHVGTGAPALVDLLGPLVAWVERGEAPADLRLVEQVVLAAPFPQQRSRPLCEWPAWPRYRGTGPADSASSFECTR